MKHFIMRNATINENCGAVFAKVKSFSRYNRVAVGQIPKERRTLMKRILLLTVLTVLFLFGGIAFAGSPDKGDSSAMKKDIVKADESLQKLPDASVAEPEGYTEPEAMEKLLEESEAKDVKMKVQKKGAPDKDKDMAVPK